MVGQAKSVLHVVRSRGVSRLRRRPQVWSLDEQNIRTLRNAPHGWMQSKVRQRCDGYCILQDDGAGQFGMRTLLYQRAL